MLAELKSTHHHKKLVQIKTGNHTAAAFGLFACGLARSVPLSSKCYFYLLLSMPSKSAFPHSMSTVTADQIFPPTIVWDLPLPKFKYLHCQDW